MSKKRRPKAGVGERIRGFLADEETLISGISADNLITGGIVDGMTFPKAVYKYGRTSIVHEGELDDRLNFSSDGSIRIGDTWTLNHHYIFGMIVAVIVAPESSKENLSQDIKITLLKKYPFSVNDIWGEREMVRDLMRDFWRDKDLFN